MEGEAFAVVFRVSVFSIACDWMANIGKVDANLIFPAGEERNFQKTKIGGFFEDFVSGFGEFSFFGIGCGIDDEGFVLGEV